MTALATALLLWHPSLRSQALPLAIERVVTSDGSVFVLLPRKTRGLTYWAEWTRMGRKHESETQAGLAEATAIASLAGTTTHGTSAPEAEAELLMQLDAALQALRSAELFGGSDGDIAALRATYNDIDAACRNLSDRFAFRRLVTSIPARPLRVTPGIDGYLIESAFDAERFDDFAVLMSSRRRDAVLRGYHEILDDVRARYRRDADTPGASHLRALALTALEVDPLRRVLIAPSEKAPPIPRNDALDFYRRHHAPNRTTTVIVGDIDVARTKLLLSKVYASASASTSLPPNDILEPPQNGPRTKVLVSTEPRLVWGWRPPDDARQDALEVLATWLQRRLEREFVRERDLAKSVTVHARFPGGGPPAPFVIELEANSHFDFRKLEVAARAAFESLERDGASGDELRREAANVQTQVLELWENPTELAATLARIVGRSSNRSMPPTEHTLEAAFELSKLVFAEARRTTVTTRPPADNQEAQK